MSRTLLALLTTLGLGAGAAIAATPSEVALEHVRTHATELGLTAADAADVVVSDEYVSEHTGVTHVYLQQRYDGVAVVNGLINANITRDGRMLHLGNRWVPDLAGKVDTRSPAIEPDAAIAAAAADLGNELGDSLALLEVVGGPSMKAIYEAPTLSYDPVPAELMYLPQGDDVRLVWSLVIRHVGSDDWWNTFVGATDGVVLDKFNWTISENFQPAERSRVERRRPGSTTGLGGGCTDNCYTVFELPKESPYDGGRTVVDNPAESIASPFGWHDNNGVAGAEFTDSRGNNVEAQTDLDANNNFTPGTDVRSQGGANLIFDDPLDLGQQPATYLEAAVTNLFYYNNIMHDLTYNYGFSEPAGNFQSNNYGNGGAQGDPVQADAQDGSGTNNANFSTPPDGFDPRMQMFVWTNPFSQLVTVNSPFTDTWVANPSNNGGTAGGLTRDVELVIDINPPTDDGCDTIVNDLTNKIALIEWNQGACNSSVFVQNAANAGALAAIIIDDTDEPFTNFGGSASIPSVAIGQANGQTLRANLPANVTIDDNNDPSAVDRDSDLDNGIIAHEYGHGISNRLVGGPGNVGCLGNQEQMGEGWSDWWALVLSAVPEDTAEMPRGIGNYASFRPDGAEGIRNFPYSTDLMVNPQTYADIGSTNVPHGVGEIWNGMLWEMYWLLVQRYGFSTNFYGTWDTAGNNLAIQLVSDGMKFTACSPGFVSGRDGILAADNALTGGANECEIWSAFAKRGVGFGANEGSTNVVGDETESFDMPPGLDPECTGAIFADGFESGDTSSWSLTVP